MTRVPSGDPEELARGWEALGMNVQARRVRERSCGSCQECCTVMAVPELTKPSYERCRHQCGSGCAVYADRPRSCRLFFCSWRGGFGPDDPRPDKLGVVIDIVDIAEDAGLEEGELMGVVVRFRGPFPIMPVARALREFRRAGIEHVAFVPSSEAELPTVSYARDERMVADRLGWASGRGTAPWNHGPAFEQRSSWS